MELNKLEMWRRLGSRKSTSREIPSGFRWDSFWGLGFFSADPGIGFLGNPNMSFASITILQNDE